MILYPCTKNPPCPNNRRHHTPVCPEMTISNTKIKNMTADKIKADVIKSTRTKANIDTVWANNPQSVMLDSLFDRVQYLTADDFDALDNAEIMLPHIKPPNPLPDYESGYYWEIAMNICENAAKRASLKDEWFKVLNTVQEEVYPIAYDAGWNEDNYAAQAAVALFMRHLVSEDPAGWNQNTYDILTGPWAVAIGKVHPNDRERSL